MEKELEKKIGQMLLIGFRGLELNDKSAISEDIINERIGGLILFDIDVELGGSKRNIESPSQLRKLIGQIKSYSKTPLFISIDQEGGLVNRLKGEYGFPQTVSQKTLGDLNREDETRYWASITANCLSEMGFNLNFAPAVDLEINPENPVIGKKERSFSSNPEIVTKHAEIIIEGHKKKNIICCIKHFPGHGSSLEDSHFGMVDVSKLWNEIELIPYKKLISLKQVDMIMTAHIFNKNLDEKYPATLSKNILTGMLRESLAFNKVIMTDDLAMKAISQNFGLEKSIELAINAGADILLFANNSGFDQDIAKKAISTIKKLLKAGKISEERIEESFNRIMELKKKMLIF
ncbi:MAG: glycoside hydrolase family 3 protein [Ignavibacteria bacterium]|jgi:beta-N-acetylhexosaminidase|nr:glycoside hydrolase family 3 protein [Ignavibacteria bacterium]